MQNANQQKGVAPVESSQFGKRLGLFMAGAFILLAILVAVDMFSGG